MDTSFPDKEYLQQLLHFQKTLTAKQDHALVTELLAHSGTNLNWIGDYISDTSLVWQKKTMNIDDLWLTGVTPEWNKYLIEEADHMPHAFRKLIPAHPEFNLWVQEVPLSHLPILVRYEEGKHKVLDGMYMVLDALLKNCTTIEAYIAKPSGSFQPQCEAHVIYDLLRSYSRGINKDKEGLIGALRFLLNSYSNVKPLLLDRLGPTWQSDDELLLLLKKYLKINMTEKQTKVDQDLCIGCGMCVSLCEKVYDLAEDTGKAFIKDSKAFSEVTEEQLEETKQECPVGAIDFTE
ncbi:MAG: ferredoxin [Candidatus Gracilibacteria bacterium]